MPASYPLDTTGLSPGNRISNEVHTLTEINAAPYRILIPTFAPFYLDNLVLTHESTTGTITTLIADSDYYLCLAYVGASRSTGKIVYGGITINEGLINGTLRLTYQTIGGDWTADAGYVRERIIEMMYNPRLTIWDLVTNKPNQFPPTQHAQPADTIFGMQKLIEALEGIKDQITTSAQAPSNNPLSAVLHPGRTDNPHGTTKEQIQLGNVQNLPLATDAEVTARASVDKYTTLKHVVALQDAMTYDKADVGLGNVDNTSDANKPVSTAQLAAIDNARNAAISAADADATTKANNAKSEAIATASADATTKANNAAQTAINASAPIAHVGATGNAHGVATQSTAGFISAGDKAKLDGITGTNTGDQTTITGNAGSATRLQTPRAIAVSGDATGTINFDGTANVAIPLVLANTGIAAGSYAKVVVDSKGRVIGNVSLVAVDIPDLDASKITTGTLSRDTSGNAATATKLLTARSITATGDATWTVSVDGTVDVTSPITLATTGVVAGQYTKVTVNAKGLVTSAALLVPSDIPSLDGSKITTGILNRDTTGNAATATRLITPRAINGVAFDGTSDIVINAQDSIARIPMSQRGVANGVATLDSNGFIPSSQLPSFVDDVLEFVNLAALPATGETGKIYLTVDNQRIYRWTGSVYIEISPTVGNSDSATRLATSRTISITGDATWSVAFDGSTNVTNSLNLVASGVTPGTYPKVQVDAKGRVTAGAALSATDVPNLDASKITTGTLSVSTNGNAATATKLTTARTINGVAFDGTDSIVVNAVDSTPRVAVTEKGAANGVATLGADGLLSPAQIPPSLDDVIEAASFAALPGTGTQGKIYITLNDNLTYRWSGSGYVSLTAPPVKTKYMTAASFYIGRG